VKLDKELNYKTLGRVEIKEVFVLNTIELTDEEAQTYNFKNKENLIEEFSRIHKHKFKPDDFLVIYALGKFEER
jgi:hypothetical protein